jgi:hypothetical protein
MQTLQAVIDSERLEPFIALPETFRNIKVEIIIRPAIHEDYQAEQRQRGYQRLLKYKGTLGRHVDYKEELAKAREEKYGRTSLYQCAD